jgi:hypothetical protein
VNTRAIFFRILAFTIVVAIVVALAWLGLRRETGIEPSPLPAPVPAPDLRTEWQSIVGDLRAFQKTFGFRETRNFQSVSEKMVENRFCGIVAKRYLPYSYEDPAVAWYEDLPQEECVPEHRGQDVYFGTREVLGEVSTPVTQSMLNGSLDRFVYLVIHEDCHDQFKQPYGIEEALCDVITHEAMKRYARQAPRASQAAWQTLISYAVHQTALSKETAVQFERVKAFFDEAKKNRMSDRRFLEQRAVLFADVERKIEWKPGDANNVTLAEAITYSRHYDRLEKIYLRLGGDLSAFVTHFQQLDPALAGIRRTLRRKGLTESRGAEYLHAYENAILDLAEQKLPAEKPAER